ncbi:MAG: threonine--tRNA ligase [Nanoarchaeota archaeon]|nr:threonine--tRNA ligase [Nanoarchaeota archaeon]
MEKEQFKDYSLKHSTSHLLASAIKSLYPMARLAIGPPTHDGFYYDFDNLEITDDDLKKIEKKMRQISESNHEFKYSEASKEEAKKLLKDEPYKLEILKNLKGKITFYTHEKFTDLCEGPHINSTKEIRHFKLTKLAGAYWRGDSKNKMLTRIYGVVFNTEKELKEYLNRIEEAKKRDHKKLGKELKLFTFSDLVGSGLPLWTPKGTILRNLLDDFVWELRKKNNYKKVFIPHITKKELYQTSGHWDKFKDELFKIKTREGHEFAMKPMNCPHHTQIFASEQRSYRDLPQRYCETTLVYRDEQSGELQGISRVRSITQDDAHVFCQEGKVEQEIEIIWGIINKFYSSFGFKLDVRLSTHDPDNFKAYLGTPESWKKSETQLLSVIKKHKVNYTVGEGEATFYGPKIDFMAYDSLGREWQVATIQLDSNMPERFKLNFTNEKGNIEQVVMIHAAIMGSIERFLSILIEHYAGKFPLWLNPVQIKILPITDKNNKYAEKIAKELEKNNIRYELDTKSNAIGKKIRESQLEKVNYMLTLGSKEEDSNTIAVRTREGKITFGVKLDHFINDLKKEIESKK